MTRAFLAAAVAAASLAVPSAGAETRVGVRVVPGSGDDRYAVPRGYARDYGNEASERGYRRGYEEGYDEGKDDAQDHDRFSFWDDKDFKKADKGYKDHYGPRYEYEQSFRRGYERGYREAFSRYDDRRYGYGYGPYTREIPRYRPYPY
jgi:hypothetical protein